MKLRRFVLIAILLNLVACGVSQYTPKEYPIRNSLISPLEIKGEVTINNVQNSHEDFIVYFGKHSKLSSNLHDITAVMVNQAKKEIAQNFIQTSSVPEKTIEISVTDLLSTEQFVAWGSYITYTATLGNGKVITKKANHASPFLEQDLNGCIAQGVVNLLQDKDVRDYLD